LHIVSTDVHKVLAELWLRALATALELMKSALSDASVPLATPIP